ncbi:MAG: NUDIX hydrolase [Deltaproteobacteria bacterium]|nr:MAG: NUDIX hydrolase [Deltaproteobacteria bacterium]TMB43599.1 MAG: NUDIX hydrolase [Deltaproteobacteria bacterium]
MRDTHHPLPTVDVVIEVGDRIVLIRRRNPPPGWALPGGFVDAGECVEDAARREAREETALAVDLTDLLGVYSDPSRDARGPTISTVFVGRATGTPQAGDDAAGVGLFGEHDLPAPLAFDHAQILADYFSYRRTGARPKIS